MAAEVTATRRQGADHAPCVLGELGVCQPLLGSSLCPTRREDWLGDTGDQACGRHPVLSSVHAGGHKSIVRVRAASEERTKGERDQTGQSRKDRHKPSHPVCHQSSSKEETAHREQEPVGVTEARSPRRELAVTEPQSGVSLVM